MTKRGLTHHLLRLPVYLYTIVLLLPVYILLVTALKGDNEVSVNPIGLPQKLMWQNFITAAEKANIITYGINSVFISTVSVLLIVVIDTLCAYGIFKLYQKNIGKMLYSFIVLGLMIPAVGYASTILLYQKLHLYNSHSALIIASVAGSLPFAIFILVGFFRGIPKEMEEAAVMDGCSDMQLLRSVMIPLVMPAVATVALFNLISTWNNFFTPLLLIRNPKLYTLPVGLLNFRGNYSMQYNLMFAAVLLIGIPVLIVYFIFQDKFVESLSGGVKG